MKSKLLLIIILNFLLLNSQIFSQNSEFCNNICNTDLKTTCNITTSTPNDQVLNQVVDRVDNSENFRICQNRCIGKSIYIPRSIGANTAREMLGWQEFIHRNYLCELHNITFSQSIGYSQSFKPEKLAELLLGRSEITFSGSQLVSRRPGDWIADYFGLSTTFNGKLNIRPIIKNIFLDTQIFFNLDNIFNGLFFQINAPLAYTQWDLNACVSNCINSTEITNNFFPACYVSPNSTPAITDLKSALSGNIIFGNSNIRNFGNIPFTKLKKFRLADIDFIFGLDYKCPEYYFGVYAQLVAPTGNKPSNNFLFSPIVGNAHHTEFGIGFDAACLIWQTCYGTCLKIYAQGNITHMFNSNQCRSFDLCNNGRFSRYLLLKEFSADNIFTGNLTSAINITTLPVKSRVPVKGDISVKLAYRTCYLDMDIGYNFYGHAQEKLCLRTNNLGSRKWGVKGNSGTCYNIYQTVGTPAQFGSLLGSNNLNSTNSNAKICNTGTIDNSQNIISNTDTIAVAWNNPRNTGPASGTDLILAADSNPPVLLNINDIDICSGTACPFITHKFFGYIGYIFNRSDISNCDNYFCNNTNYKAFIGLAGEIEFEGLARNERSSLNQWALYIKAGFIF